MRDDDASVFATMVHATIYRSPIVIDKGYDTLLTRTRYNIALAAGAAR